MEFEYKPNVKVVVDFEVGEKVLIKGFSPKTDGHHTIEKITTNFGRCSSGIMIKVSGHESALDSGWITKIKQPQ